jgi:hypothetical protein
MLTPAIAKAHQEFEDQKAQWAFEKMQLEKEVDLLHKTQQEQSQSLRDRDREMCDLTLTSQRHMAFTCLSFDLIGYIQLKQMQHFSGMRL